MGHSQFAELFGVRGPNTAVNAACASATQAIAFASDWIRTGRCRRVIVISADDVSSSGLHEWFGAGFLAAGAATTEERLELAALPFDKRRNGMLVGMGAGAVVVEAEDALAERGMRGIAEVLVTETANSAYHGTRLDVDHICDVMDRTIASFERSYGVPRAAAAREMLFMSHETYTPARGGSAAAEIHALRRTFGSSADDIVIANTKGFTGHPMGVAIEDVVAMKALERQIVPPVPNYREPDPELGRLNLSRGGHYPVRYALRFAAGFGSHMALTLVRRVPGCEQRVRDSATYQRWLSAISGYEQPTTEVEHRTLRIHDLRRSPARAGDLLVVPRADAGVSRPAISSGRACSKPSRCCTNRRPTCSGPRLVRPRRRKAVGAAYGGAGRGDIARAPDGPNRREGSGPREREDWLSARYVGA